MTDTIKLAQDFDPKPDAAPKPTASESPWSETLAMAKTMQGAEATPQHAEQAGPQRLSADWFDQNLFGSMRRAAEDVGNATHLPALHFDKEQLPEANFLSPEWVAQTAGSLLVQAPVYVALGRLTGAGMRQYAAANSLEASWVGRVAASETATQMAGAGVFDLARDPENGETRFGNFAKGQVMFGIIGGSGLARTAESVLPEGTSMASNFGDRFAQQLTNGTKVARFAAAGFAGSVADQTFRDDGKPFSMNDAVKATVAGLAMPMFQRGGASVANFVDRSILDRGIPIGRYIDEQRWSNEPISAVRNTDGRLLRVKETETKIESDGVIPTDNIIRITPKDTSIAKQRDLAHEVGHKLSEKDLFADISNAQDIIRTSGEAAGKEAYIEARRRDEDRANAFAAKIVGGDATFDPIKPARQTDQHENQYSGEANLFAATNGAFRPQISFAGGHGKGDGSSYNYATRGLTARKALEFDEKTGIRTFNYETPKTITIDGKDYETQTYSVRPKEGGKTGELEYQKLITVSGHEYVFDSKGTKTPYGDAEYIEKGPGKVYERYTIKNAPDPNPLGIQAGSKVEVYPLGADTPFGTAHFIEKRPDGSTVYRNTSADKTKNFDAYENVPSKSYEFGLYENVKFDSVTQMADGAVLRTNKQGSSMFELPRGESVAINIMTATGRETIEGVTQVFRAGDNGTVYRGKFGEIMVDRDGEGGLQITKFHPDKAPEQYTAKRVFEDYREQYPAGILYERSPSSPEARDRDRARYVDIRPEALRYYTAGGTKIVEMNHDWTEHGVIRIEHDVIPAETTGTGKAQIGDQTRVYTDGMRYVHFVKPRTTLDEPAFEQTREKPFGDAIGYWEHGQDAITYDVPGVQRSGISWPQSSSQSFHFDQPFVAEVNGARYDIRLTKRDLDKVEYTTAQNDRIIVPLGSFESIKMYSADGTLKSADLGKYLVEHVDPPQMTPFGATDKIAVRSDGSVRYEILNHPDQTEVIQFVAPKSLTVGTKGGQSENLDARFAKRAKDGTWKLVLQDGRTVAASDDLLLKIRSAPVEDRSGSFYTPKQRKATAANGGSAQGEAQTSDESSGDFAGYQ